jgi:hypothetical protein
VTPRGALLIGALALATVAASAADAPSRADGAAAFVDVTKVLLSPRCVNCHPAGDAPHVGDDFTVHPMKVQRGLERLGMACQTCHRERATSASRAPGAPPAVKGWGLPPKEHPMVFEGKSAKEICEQMKDPKQNGGKNAQALAHHVKDDAVVLYGWDPGGNRTLPPLSHETFSAKFQTWLDAGMPCPE